MRRPAKTKPAMLHLLKRNTQHVIRITCCVFLLLYATACTQRANPTYFVPPTAPTVLPSATDGIALTTATPLSIDLSASATPQEESTPEPELPSPTPACTNALAFLEDVTIPDGSVLDAGASFVKQWRIKNDGDCDWDSSYTLRLVSGDALGAPTETTLYPARAGAEIIIEMNLVAPSEAGQYHTVWQAYDSDGNPFEQAIYVDFVVE